MPPTTQLEQAERLWQPPGRECRPAISAALRRPGGLPRMAARSVSDGEGRADRRRLFLGVLYFSGALDV